ncbi:MAG: hypothetical protein ACLP07_04985 [Terracidiphilus sp.]
MTVYQLTGPFGQRKEAGIVIATTVECPSKRAGPAIIANKTQKQVTIAPASTQIPILSPVLRIAAS